MEQHDMPTILIIEDDSSVREFCCKALELEGYRVLSAEDGEAGLAMARVNGPAAVILDLKLPVRSGWSFLEEVRKDQSMSSTAILVFSASVDEASRQKALNMGAAEFLHKPISVSALTKAVSRALKKGGLDRP